MANDTNKIKLLVLWDILCKNTDENHAMNSDEIREELAKRGISVMRKVVATDIAALNKYGYYTPQAWNSINSIETIPTVW